MTSTMTALAAAASRRRTAGRQLLVAGAALLASCSITAAQDATFDFDQLPAFNGRVAYYDLTPRGDVDGLILVDGTEVHFPPPLGVQVVAIVRPGDDVTLHGLKARALALIEASSVENAATHQKVVDRNLGPPRPPTGPSGPGTALEASGKVKMQLHGPRGELNGVLLEDGTMIHLPPPEALRLAQLLAPGSTVFVRGKGVASVLGRSIAAMSIGSTPTHIAQVETPSPPRRPLPPPDGGLPPPPPRP